MYRAFTVKNFRCFDNLRVEPLGRVNLFAGRNNVGKTALLEALRLFVGHDDGGAVLDMDRLSRGLGGSAEAMVEASRWLFPRTEPAAVVEMEGVSSDDPDRPVRLQVSQGQRGTLVPSGLSSGKSATPPGAAAFVREIFFEWNQERGQSKRISMSVSPSSGPVFTGPVNFASTSSSAYLGTMPPTMEQLAVRFSELDKKNRQGEALSALQLLEPRLTRLALQFVAQRPVLCGDIGLEELVPLCYMGEGIVRLCNVVCAIAAHPHGVVLVDEIENGIHYSAMVDVWKAIALAARKADTQVFATTHSWECICAAHRAFAEGKDYDSEFRLHRLDRAKDTGAIRAFTHDQETLSAAIETGLEVR